MDTGSRPTRRSGCCVSLGILQFARPGRFAVAATDETILRLRGGGARA